ncbi:MAG: hypothetical protein KKC64_14425 [Spirochaetes bacterium]|nr:hypothetical protein [Spirochaetota bacterium]
MDLEAEVSVTWKEAVRFRRALRLRRQVLDFIAPCSVDIATSDEPVAWNDVAGIDFRPAQPGQSWGKAFSCAWFRVSAQLPDSGDYELLLDFSGEGLVYRPDGTVVHGISDRVCWVDRLLPAPGKKLVRVAGILGDSADGQASGTGQRAVRCLVDAGYNGGSLPPFGRSRYRGAWLVRRNRDFEAFYLDFVVLVFAAAACNAGPRRSQIRAALDQAWTALGSSHSAVAGDPERLTAAHVILKSVMEAGQPGEQFAEAWPSSSAASFTAVGHSHLDLAWLWPIRETRRKAQRTFSNALAFMERYPWYVYGASQPQQFEWLKEDNPELYERVCTAVAAGRLEAQGGMWVEPDMNLPSGESLVRQLCYGMDFFEREFGKTMETCWLPDVFGYNANLPQILAKCGIKNFMTIKLSWNETTLFPYRSFVWEALDGSAVLVHMPPEGDYNSGATPLCNRRAVERHPERAVAAEALVLYGAGDGGGGPGEAHLAMVQRQRALPGFPTLQPGTAEAFFRRLAAHATSLPRWKGELYLEKHQGTYTTQARIKRANRLIEGRLHEAEALLAAALTAGMAWPQAALDRIWKEVLLYQFHDILPGSSIGRVYAECLPRYEAMMAELEILIDQALTWLGGHSAAGAGQPAGGAGQPVGGAADAAAGVDCNATVTTAADGSRTPVWYNPSAFARSAYRKYPGGAGAAWCQVDAPAYGFARGRPAAGPFTVWHKDDEIGNELVRLRFARDGSLSFFGSIDGTASYLLPGSNRLVVHQDPWRFFNAWDIIPWYHRLPAARLRAVRTETSIDGPELRRRMEYRHGKSRIVQEVIITYGSPLVIFDTRVEWHERHRMLRTEFRPAHWSPEVSCDIQFGSYRRSTGSATAQERAQFEICAHRWVDIGDDQAGFSLLNDCKYGHRAKDGIISLNLLRSPWYPDPQADQGSHHFRYAILARNKPLSDSETHKYGWELNSELRPCRAGLAPLANNSSFVYCDDPGVEIVTVTKAPDSNDIIVRLCEMTGQARSCALRAAFRVSGAWESDMRGRGRKECRIESLEFAGWETKTVVLGEV